MVICFDIDPKSKYGSNHKPDTCVRRWNGPIQKALGVDYLTMLFSTPRAKIEKVRKKVFAEIMKEKAEARKGGKGKSKTSMVNERLPMKRKASDDKPVLTFYEARFIAMTSFPDDFNTVETLQQIRKYYQKKPKKEPGRSPTAP